MGLASLPSPMIEKLRSSWATLAWPHRLWFTTVLVLSLVFMMLMPPFQTNDEPSHWRRLWSTACGQLVCGEPIPRLATEVMIAANYWGIRDQHEKFEFRRWDLMRAIQGTTRKELAGGNACVYVPIAYVLPALAMRPFMNVFDPRDPAGMLPAFYASRAANWLLMALGVLMFLLLSPTTRNLTLVLYSLPTVMQQTTVVNQEATLLVLMFALLLLWRMPPKQWSVLVMLVVVTALSLMKAVFLVLLLLWLATLVRWRRLNASVTRLRVALIAALAIIPITLQALWSHFVVAVSGKEFLPGWGVDPAGQIQYLKQHPLALAKVLLQGHLDLFGQDHLRGGWTSVLGVLGWAEIEIGRPAYLALFAAVLVALLADAAQQSTDARESVWLRDALPALSTYLLLPAVMTAMYLVFTGVGGDRILGVQGRYLLYPYFMLLTFALDYVGRTRVPQRLRAIDRRVWLLVPWLGAALCVFADWRALGAMLARFY